MIVIEDLGCFEKADSVLLLVLPSLVRIPLEYQHRASDSNLTSAFCRAEPSAKRRGIGVGQQRVVRLHVGCSRAISFVPTGSSHTLCSVASEFRRLPTLDLSRRSICNPRRM